VFSRARWASEPGAIVRLIRKRASDVVRVGLESGPTSVWHPCAHGRGSSGGPRGLAEMVRVGWFKVVWAKSLPAHERKTLLIVRHRLVDMRVRIDNIPAAIRERAIRAITVDYSF
jgi:transposase